MTRLLASGFLGVLVAEVVGVLIGWRWALPAAGVAVAVFGLQVVANLAAASRPAPAGAPATDGSLLEPLLRIKCLLLAAVALKRRSFRWLAKLPPEVVGCARCGAACPLFWPPAPDYPHAGERWERAGRPAWSILQS